MAERRRSESGDEPAWTASAVAAHLGVSVVTLRSWSRRYGLDPTGHRAGQHRRYRPADVARLQTLRRLVASGMAPADAARWVLAHPDRTAGTADLAAEQGPALTRDTPPPSGSGSSPESRALPNSTADALEPDRDAHTRAESTATLRAVAPHAVASHAVASLVAAATRLDSDALTAALDAHLQSSGVPRAWEEVCVPALAAISRRQLQRGDCIDVEHLLSTSIIAALQRLPRVQPSPGGRVVLLACVEREWHTLALHALQAALAPHRVSICMLGAATPARALGAAVDRVEPGAVVLWAQTGATARTSVLRSVLASLHGADRSGHSSINDSSLAPALLAAGPGWRHRRLPSAAVRIDSLRQAMRLCLRASAPPL